MKHSLIFCSGFILAVLLSVSCPPVRAQEVITFMPQWTPQTQFAGYYVAMEKGFYEEEGLEVELDHFGGSSKDTAMDHLLTGRADIITSQLVSAMIACGKGARLVNVLQTSQVNGLMCAAHFPLTSPQALDSVKVGRWKVGFGEVCDIFCRKNGIHVDWIPYIQGINLFVFGAVDALLCYSYSEFLQLELATGGIPKENVIRFKDFGLNYPEDGLYVTEKYYRSHKEEVEKFARASQRGWDYAREHPEEALEISMSLIERFRVATNRTLQRKMLEEVLNLQVNPATGRADYAPVARPVFDELCGALQEAGHLKSDIKYEDLIR